MSIKSCRQKTAEIAVVPTAHSEVEKAQVSLICRMLERKCQRSTTDQQLAGGLHSGTRSSLEAQSDLMLTAVTTNQTRKAMLFRTMYCTYMYSDSFLGSSIEMTNFFVTCRCKAECDTVL